METFCRTATSRLSAELRAPLELEIIASSQLTWSHAHSQVPDGSLTAVIGSLPVGTRMMLAGEQAAAAGRDRAASRRHRAAARSSRGALTDIDWALAAHFFDRLLGQMSIIWADMFEIELSTEALDQHLETAQSAPVSEPTLSADDRGAPRRRLQRRSCCCSRGRRSRRSIERFSGREEHTEVDRRRRAPSVRRAVGGVEVPVRAEVAGVAPADRGGARAASPGDVLSLQAPADGGVTLYADKVPVHRARPGRSGSRRAVQITGAAPEVRDEPEAALTRLGAVLLGGRRRHPRDVRPGKVEAGDVAVLEPGSNPLAGLPFPAVATNVSYVDGVTGGNVFVMTLEGARRLAAAMMGAASPSPPATARGADRARGLRGLGGHEPDDGHGRGRDLLRARHRGRDRHARDAHLPAPSTETADAYPASPHLVRAAFSVCGEPCRLVQLVPNAFVVRMDARARRALRRDRRPRPARRRPPAAGAAPGAPSLAGIPVRVWAELGRAQHADRRRGRPPTGAVVELDRSPDEPIDLYVNGRRFATGRLVVVDGNDWAVRIESVLDPSSDTSDTEGEVA